MDKFKGLIARVRTSVPWQYAKWVGLALWGGFMAALMFAYGKKTTQGLMAQVAAHNQKGKLLNAQIATHQAKAQATADTSAAQSHLERADTLKVKQEDVRQARLRLIEESGDLVPDDDSRLAAADNSRRRRAATG